MPIYLVMKHKIGFLRVITKPVPFFVVITSYMFLSMHVSMIRKAYISVICATLPLLVSCEKNNLPDNIDYRQEMRDFVIGISDYARNTEPGFIVIPQNGQELVTNNGETDGTLESAYLAAINAVGREDLFYGYNRDEEATPASEMQYMLDYCLLYEQNSVEVLVTDYCSTHIKMDDSYARNNTNGFISFAADNRDLNDIPGYPAVPYSVNNDDIQTVADAKNFLYLINGEKYNTKQEFIHAVSATDYDLIIIDLFHDNVAFTAQEIAGLKLKKNGGKRLVICYMSIGEAEDYRYYWNTIWLKNQPEWLYKENPDWEGNYKVWYWDPEWQSLIYGNNDAYLDRIMAAGFDGVYLDIIDAFEYYEDL
ncbi:endo alpha-1,4 polygalactosaminidase [Saccharicrinis sp. FJH54]|uniref:endo alpha-1,4 polygalactosaminidase n=1 Tax=Saccharicrinis sp. FJH54 TaxID=3344665 RepID=UPI0035D4A4BB